MFGFRPYLSTQDVFLQLHADIVNRVSQTTPHAVLALNIKGAFDNLSDKLVLKKLESTNCGEKTYNYVKDFFCNCTATFGIESIRSDIIQVPDKGTPQGLVLSPTLFNLAMRKLVEKLDAVPPIKHSFYADDLRIRWKAGRPTRSHKSDEKYLKEGGLQCTPEEFELLSINSRRKRKSSTEMQLEFKDSNKVPVVKKV